MGVLTDLVVATRADAQRVCDSDNPSKEFSGLDAKGIDTMKFGTLHAILTRTEFDPSSVRGEPLASGGDEGPWIVEVPADLVQRLAALDAKQIHEVATKWAKTEEFSPEHDNWPPEAVHDVLHDIADLCVKATASRKCVLMWMSL